MIRVPDVTGVVIRALVTVLVTGFSSSSVRSTMSDFLADVGVVHDCAAFGAIDFSGSFCT